MAKIENVVLHTLKNKEGDLKNKIAAASAAAAMAEIDFNKFTNERETFESDLKQIQDAIALIENPKKKAKNDSKN